jgi:hypothetical protein
MKMLMSRQFNGASAHIRSTGPRVLSSMQIALFQEVHCFLVRIIDATAARFLAPFNLIAMLYP